MRLNYTGTRRKATKDVVEIKDIDWFIGDRDLDLFNGFFLYFTLWDLKLRDTPKILIPSKSFISFWFVNFRYWLT